MAKAVLNDGKYIASAPELVGNLTTFLRQTKDHCPDSGPILIGFDFPIGLPNTYATKRGVANFLDFFESLTPDSEFFKICRHQHEISLQRPFYPNSPGGRQQQHLTNALGIEFTSLLRSCDQATKHRPAASALFWNLGAKQVGKAAIVGWCDLLTVAYRDKEIKFWPFQGRLNSLLEQEAITVAETYPAEYYRNIFGELNGSKTVQEFRVAVAPRILDWAAKRSEYLSLTPALKSEIESGFTIGNDDAFDAVIGLFGMIDAIQNWDSHLEPEDPIIRNIEGCILGQPTPPTLRNPAKIAGMPSIDELNRRHAISGVAQILTGNGDLPKIQITTPEASAEIYLHGAHLTSWHPAGTEEGIFLSSKSSWQDGKAIRGGVPICFPWFRAKADDPKAPSHGVVRTKSWEIDSIARNGSIVTATLSTGSDEATRIWWPHDFRITHRLSIGRELKMELTVQNTGTSPFQFEEALHTYHHIGSAAEVAVHGLDGVTYLDNRDSNRSKLQSGDIHFSVPTDNAYMDTIHPVEIVDPKLRRRIRIEKEDSRTTIVWNPWQQVAATLADLGSGEWHDFVCVEASNIMDYAVSLAPGAEHTVTATIHMSQE